MITGSSPGSCRNPVNRKFQTEMKKPIFILAVILGGIVSLFTLSSCAQEETETTIEYYNLLDASGRQVNVSANVSQESTNSK